MITGERIFIVAGAFIALLLQILVVPHMALFGGMAMPNMLVIFVMLVAVSRPGQFGPVLPFVLGLVFDFVGGGPVGAMAFSLTVFSMAVSAIIVRSNNDSAFVALVLLALGLLLMELSYGAFLMLFGYRVDLLGALAYRIVPCFLYDVVVAAVLYPIASRFLQAGGGASLGGFATLR